MILLLTIVGVSAVIMSIAMLIGYFVLILRPQLESKKPFPNLPNLPTPPNQHFIMGHIKLIGSCDFATGFAEFAKYCDQYGRTAAWMANVPLICVNHWEDARTVLKAEYQRHQPKAASHHLAKLAGKKNVLFLNGHEWKYHRAAIVRTFTPQAIKTAQPAMVKVTNELVTALQKRILSTVQTTTSTTSGATTSTATTATTPFIEQDIELMMKMATFDIFGEAALSESLGCCRALEPSPVAKAFDYVVADVFRRLETGPINPLHWFYKLPTAANKKFNQQEHIIRTFVKEVVDRHVVENKKIVQATGNTKSKDSKDLLDHILDSDEQLQEVQTVSNDMLIDVCMSLLFAGYDTTSILLSYTTFLISIHPHVEDKVVQECMKYSSLDMTNPDNLDKLVYLKAALREGLRMFPPAFISTRTLQKDTKFTRDNAPPEANITIPAGTHVVIPIWTILRSERHYPNPMEFQPERWVRKKDDDDVWIERNDDPNHPSEKTNPIPLGNMEAFLGFSAGARKCPGFRFAWNEAITVLYGLMSNFKFTPIPGGKDSIHKLQAERQAVVQHCHGGIPMHVSLRN